MPPLTQRCVVLRPDWLEGGGSFREGVSSVNCCGLRTIKHVYCTKDKGVLKMYELFKKIYEKLKF